MPEGPVQKERALLVYAHRKRAKGPAAVLRVTEVMEELAHWLCTMTGMPAVALSPKAGAHGEFCGMLAIKAALVARGEADTRRRVLVPHSAHGTNPATAAAAGFVVDEIEGNGDGRVHVDDVKAKLGPDVAAIMITNPNTCGLFEPEIKTIADAVHLGYVDQSRDTLAPNKTVWEEISGGNELLMLGKREMNSRAYTSAFNFKGADQQQKVGNLSGGQRNRVHLAKMLKEGGNLLLLDEPTNDLDTETLSALEAALEDFAGCAVVISHDRFFLDRMATHILAFEGDSQVEWFEGNFADYEEDKKRRLGDASVEPHRIKFKRFERR